MTGLYPKSTGAWLNHNAMDRDMTTWAQILRQKRGYYTGYVGKWHLDGNEKPGWNPNSDRSFGFTENEWRYNRGHWKFFEKLNGEQEAYEWDQVVNDNTGRKAYEKFANSMETNYATDFLMDKGIDVMRRAINANDPFAVMISIPDPHSPNIVRPPYDSMYDDMEFKVPYSGKAALKKEPSLPGWSALNLDISQAWSTIDELEHDETRKVYYRRIFGMIKLVDDNVGKLLDFLERKGVDKNTIIVFSSDHGDMLGEHAKHNKGKPYETSAGVPMLLRWPNGVSKGRVIDTAYSNIDFAPTILSMMNVNLRNTGVEFHGIDGSDEVLAHPSEDEFDNFPDTESQTRFISDSQQGKWASAVRNSFKLVLSKGEPWLFDLSADPQELYNVYGHTNYTEVGEEMKQDLSYAMHQHSFPLTESDVVFWNKPACWDTRDQLSMWKKRVCAELADPRYSPGCQFRHIYEQCPVACKRCCEDSEGHILIKGELKSCNTVTDNDCDMGKVSIFCPVTCNACPGQRPDDELVGTDDDEFVETDDAQDATDGDDYGGVAP